MAKSPGHGPPQGPAGTGPAPGRPDQSSSLEFDELFELELDELLELEFDELFELEFDELLELELDDLFELELDDLLELEFDEELDELLLPHLFLLLRESSSATWVRSPAASALLVLEAVHA